MLTLAAAIIFIMTSLSYEYEMCTILQSNAQTWLLFESLDSFGPDKCHKEFYNGEFSEHTDNVYLMQECQRISKDVLTQKSAKLSHI